MDSPHQPSSPALHLQPGLPLVGISSCLLGIRVRYDGQHKFQASVIELIEPFVRLLPLCPESMAGMGIPRKPVNLIALDDGVQAVGRDDPERNVTARMRTMGRIVANTYPELCGYILQSRSPSCGLASTPIYNRDQTEILQAEGNGLFVDELLQLLPGLPVLDDRQLNATDIHSFLDQVQARAATLRNSNP